MFKKKKHVIIKNHESHKSIIAVITTILIVIVMTLLYRMLDLSSVTESEFRTIVIVFLITLNIIVLIFAIIVIHFLIEVKDKYLDEE